MKNRKKYEKLPQDLDNSSSNYQQQSNTNSQNDSQLTANAAAAAAPSGVGVVGQIQPLIDLDDDIDNLSFEQNRAVDSNDSDDSGTNDTSLKEERISLKKVNFYTDDLIGSSEEDEIILATTTTSTGVSASKSAVTTTLVGSSRHFKKQRRHRKQKQKKKQLTSFDNNTPIEVLFALCIVVCFLSGCGFTWACYRFVCGCDG